MVRYIDDHRDRFGVEPICAVLPSPLHLFPPQGAAPRCGEALGARPAG
jgi:hypothetical protein